ncbi:MAG: anti-sigma factor [Methylacidiphilales bacterium]|nr:anti-sigma factor [Candidatus Methylacidiphilales bacterium]
MMDRAPAQNSKGRAILSSPWIPLGIATVLVIFGIIQLRQIVSLKAQLSEARKEVNRLNESNALDGLRLSILQARDPDPAYASATVLVAWDPHQNRGVLTSQNPSAPPEGQSYHLWVLDPTAAAPINTGAIIQANGSVRFGAEMVNSTSPGFAISLEPGTGPATTTGTVLFAISPGE